ncbi:MAG: amidohydrolase family protein [Clostridiales bacterium]|nr:amidohydrolase family protein [Clostridiales bacterium]
MKKHILILFSILLLAASLIYGQSQNEGYTAIKGAHIIPVVGEDIPVGTILIKDKLIEAVGKDIVIPASARIVDGTGLYAYPGMIDSFCFLSLSEISSIPATIDYRETGRINPQVRSVEALRPDSMHIPITRSNGITAALVVPSGGLIAGQSGLIRLTGWTPGEMVIKSPVAMHVEFPSLGRRGFQREQEPREEASKQVIELKDWLNKARFYQKRKQAAAKNMLLQMPEFDEKLEFLHPVVNGELPLMISVHADKDIRAAIKFVQEEKIKAIFFGMTQGWKVAEEIAKAGIPVVFGSLYDMPPSWEDGYDALYRNPAALQKAGVKIAFSSQSASLAKDLPYHAAKAAAFGLEKREALKAVTINPAEILGVADIMGSLEKGKLANIVLANGDILELRTTISRVFIDGQEIDFSSRYTELLDKYKPRLKQKK